MSSLDAFLEEDPQNESSCPEIVDNYTEHPSLKAFLRNYPQYGYSVPEIVEHYSTWVKDTRYMLLSKWNKVEWKNDVFAVKSAKRGNDVYRSRVRRKFEDLCSMAQDLTLFNPKERGIKKTRALWITLTYRIDRCTFGVAWRNIGIELNRFMSLVRKKYGKVSCLRVFESFENGYPHVHCILLFETTWFTVFRDNKNQFRIQGKKIFNEWWHSNLDIKGMSSLSGGFTYLKKYLLKGINFKHPDSKALKTVALCWAFRKRAFSVSGKFRKLLSDLITKLKGLKWRLRQTTLTGEIIPEEKFYVLGFVSAEVIGLREDVWFRKLDSKQIEAIQPYLNEYYSF